ncbi:MAG: phosphoadenosine phosphosulfate reductase family protein [Pedobacter sp.]|uniref:phosphoadenosine phosphosulfate reductase family protein n=1 Tax=Pedobacter sp. TaxID=1411316 RepID=UPI003568A0C1
MVRCITQKEAEQRKSYLSDKIIAIRLQPKIDSAMSLIESALVTAKLPVVNFSGGKDSLVVLDLVRKIVDAPAVFCNTGNEYIETIPYVRGFENVIELMPEKSFWACVKEYGLPENKRTGKRHGNACCFWLKEKPLKKYYKESGADLVFTGLTSDESRQRMMTLKRMGAYYFHKSDGNHKCHPIHDWSPQDVWDYIGLKKLQYNPIYDMGIPRCGCRFCTAYLTCKKITSLYNYKDTMTLQQMHDPTTKMGLMDNVMEL